MCRLSQSESLRSDPEVALAQWRALLASAGAPSALPVAPAAGDQNLRMVTINEVLYFEAANKYVRVLTADAEQLIRTPLRPLQAQLDPQRFWQVHRSVLVNSSATEAPWAPSRD